jgi:hypothetical protein
MSGNKLVERDAETNAIIPVIQAYSSDMSNKKAHGNYLVVRDAKTNAIIPVVKVIGINPSNPDVDEEQLRLIVREELEDKVVGTTDAVVRNTTGNSQTDAISQALFTETTDNWNQGW